MPSPLHGLNVIDPYPANSSTSQASDQLPPDVAAQLDLWSTLSFNSIDDALPVGGFSVQQPFSLGSGTAPGTLDDLIHLGEEELAFRSSFSSNSTVDPFQIAPNKKARTSSSSSKTAKQSVHQTEEDEDDESKDDSSATPLNAAEDKRRRNTAASARFRAKKKEREAALETRAKQLEGRVGELERECEALRRENGWLKGLVVGVTQAGGDLNVSAGVPGSLPIPGARQPSAGAKRKRE